MWIAGFLSAETESHFICMMNKVLLLFLWQCWVTAWEPVWLASHSRQYILPTCGMHDTSHTRNIRYEHRYERMSCICAKIYNHTSFARYKHRIYIYNQFGCCCCCCSLVCLIALQFRKVFFLPNVVCHDIKDSTLGKVSLVRRHFLSTRPMISEVCWCDECAECLLLRFLSVDSIDWPSILNNVIRPARAFLVYFFSLLPGKFDESLPMYTPFPCVCAHKLIAVRVNRVVQTTGTASADNH